MYQGAVRRLHKIYSFVYHYTIVTEIFVSRKTVTEIFVSRKTVTEIFVSRKTVTEIFVSRKTVLKNLSICAEFCTEF